MGNVMIKVDVKPTDGRTSDKEWATMVTNNVVELGLLHCLGKRKGKKKASAGFTCYGGAREAKRWKLLGQIIGARTSIAT